jgi:hypothetical protein
METKLVALSTSIARLDDLRKAIKTDQIESPNVLATKMNQFAGSLGALFEAGREMDQASLIEIPMDMLSFLDGDISNPELYYYHAIQEAEECCTKLQSRISHLQSLRDLAPVPKPNHNSN